MGERNKDQLSLEALISIVVSMLLILVRYTGFSLILLVLCSTLDVLLFFARVFDLAHNLFIQAQKIMRHTGAAFLNESFEHAYVHTRSRL